MVLIGRAVALLSLRFSPCRVYLSDYIESEPWGFDSPHPFLNRGVLIIKALQMAPVDVLDATQSVEREIGGDAPHRRSDGSYCDRPIDIDIIDIDGMRLDTPRLVLPHPRARLRPFVTIPMDALEAMHP